MDEENKTPSIEEALDQLEDLIKKMEDKDRPLEETFALYEEGMKMVKLCNEKIDKVEKQIQVLSEEGTDGEL